MIAVSEHVNRCDAADIAGQFPKPTPKFPSRGAAAVKPHARWWLRFVEALPWLILCKTNTQSGVSFRRNLDHDDSVGPQFDS